jgi:hypothetical protein
MPALVRGLIAAAVVVVLVAAGAFAGAAWQRSRDAKLDVTHLGADFTLQVPVDTEYASFYLGDMCLSRPGPAEILAVRAAGDHQDVEVSDFVVLPDNRNISGGEPHRLRDVRGFDRGSRTVAQVCAQGSADVIVEVRRSAARNVAIHRVTIDYRVAGRTHTVGVDASMGLCDDPDDDCEP